MRILFVHEVNYLDKPIYEMHEFPEHLAKRGHDIGFWHFPEGYELAKIMTLGWRKQIHGRVVGRSGMTLFTPQISGNFLGRLLTVALAHYFAEKAIKEFKPQLIVSYSVPTQGWQTIRVAKKLGVPVVFRALDVSHRIRKGPFWRFIYWAEVYTYRNADWVSANNPAMLEYCLKMGANSLRSSVDWPPIDLSQFGKAASSLGLRNKLGIPKGHKIILYMGSFFYFSGLPDVIREFARASAHEHLVLIGGGEQDSDLRKLVENLGMSHKVTFTGFVSFGDLPAYLKLADVAINPMKPSLVAHAAIPNKVIQYLASGLVVVSTHLKGLELSFGQSNALHFVDSPQQVAKRALDICRGVNQSVDCAGVPELEQFSLGAAIRNFEVRCTEVAGHD